MVRFLRNVSVEWRQCPSWIATTTTGGYKKCPQKTSSVLKTRQNSILSFRNVGCVSCSNLLAWLNRTVSKFRVVFNSLTLSIAILSIKRTLPSQDIIGLGDKILTEMREHEIGGERAGSTNTVQSPTTLRSTRSPLARKRYNF